MKYTLILIISTLIFIPVGGQTKYQSRSIKDKQYGVSYYDFNKNKKLDAYENSTLDIDTRVEDLLAQMTIEEKVGQLLTTLGWHMYKRVDDNKIELTNQLSKELEQYQIGSLWGFMRADPWTQRTLKTGLNATLAPKASNMLQDYAIQNTRLGIPLLLAEECPHGHMAIGTTVFPTSIGQSSTWNPKLIEEMGSIIAEEAKSQGAHIGYGPVLDLARDPRWSRVEETYGEDPFLVGKMGAALVRGFQGEKIDSKRTLISTLKHFAAYGWTEGGHNGGSALLGEYEMESSILPPFKDAVKAGALSVMSSYNEIDGIPCTGNSHLMRDVLKNRWNFSGFVVSDLYAIGGLREHGVAVDDYDATVKAFNAGVDSDLGMNMYGEHLAKAVKNGDVSQDYLDDSVRRMLKLKFQMGLFDHPFVDEKLASATLVSPKNLEVARRVARESIVMLKNENETLPLSKNIKTIAVIGPNADNGYNMLGDYTAPQSETSVVTVLKGIQNKVSSTSTILYAKGCSIRDQSEHGFAEALATARKADVIVIAVGGSSARDFSSEYEDSGAAKVSANTIADMESGEGYDRSTLELMGVQLKLIEKVKELGKPIVLVFIKGRPLLMEGVIQETDAILDAWYPGMQGGNAIADVLFGDYNPAGRLSISVPRSVGQLPVYYNTKRKGNRSEYIEGTGLPRYSFGYGLSYTKFDYSNLQVSVNELENKLSVTVEFMVTNNGKIDGDEVVQLYMRDDVSSFTTPNKQLRAFERINIKAGESQKVRFQLDENTLALYKLNNRWEVEPGTFTLMVGSSSDNILLEKQINIKRNYSVK